MAASKAELWTQLKNAIKILDETYKYSFSNTPNFLTLLDTLTQSLEGIHASQTTSAFSSYRNSLNSLVGQSSPLNALLIELARNGYNSRATNAQDAIDDIVEGMDGASETVTERDWTHGAVSVGGSNVGTGTVYRLTTDKYGNAIEAGAIPAGVTKLECVLDKNTGSTKGNESFLVGGYGLYPVDNIEYGTCPAGTVSANATRSEDGKLANSSFETYTGTGATLAFTSWTLGSATDAAAETSTYFRTAPGLTTGTSVSFTDNNSITQYVQDSVSRIDKTKPVFLIARYRRVSSCDGTLTLRLGSKTTAIDLSTVSDATWYDLVLGASDENGWYDNYKEDSSSKGFRVALTLTSNTTGSLLLDSVILAQPFLYDGKWYLITAGATDFLKSDYFTFTDSVANTGRIQTTLARLFGKYLPHTSGTPTYADA